MATTVSTRQRNPTLERHIKEHRAEVARFRADHGDPIAAFRSFVRKTFTPEALNGAYEEYLNGGRGDRSTGD